MEVDAFSRVDGTAIEDVETTGAFNYGADFSCLEGKKCFVEYGAEFTDSECAQVAVFVFSAAIGKQLCLFTEALRIFTNSVMDRSDSFESCFSFGW